MVGVKEKSPLEHLFNYFALATIFGFILMVFYVLPLSGYSVVESFREGDALTLLFRSFGYAIFLAMTFVLGKLSLSLYSFVVRNRKEESETIRKFSKYYLLTFFALTLLCVIGGIIHHIFGS